MTMTTLDRDLQSIQQARDLVAKARQAQQNFLSASQADVDRICEAMAAAAYDASARLGTMAHEETGYGVPKHKRLKNEFASKQVWESIRDEKTVGVIFHDSTKKIYHIGWPMGVVAALTPSTNPTSTVMFKILIAVKTRNAIVLAPHPASINCCLETTRLMVEAGVRAGMPPGLVSCMSSVSLEGTQALMEHRHTAVILATGGAGMVKAAHSVGKPAYGVGPGNVPCYVDRSADIKQAAHYIVSSKAFDCSVICATEQAVIADKPIAASLKAEMMALGAHFVTRAEADALGRTLFASSGAIDAKSVGKTPQQLAHLAGITVPQSAKILVAPLTKVGPDEPLSREKLTTVLGWYEANGWEAGCDLCMDLIMFGGRGHSLFIHAQDDDIILKFGLEKPVFRIGVNTMGTMGSIGITTAIEPSMTLGSGGIGGSISGDNISARHLLNVKRLAYETKPPPAAAMIDDWQEKTAQRQSQTAIANNQVEHLVEDIVKQVLNELKKHDPEILGNV
ncbi:MAG: aldehyde dehydrogenase family protein [Chloroflexota bacterium]